MWLLLFGGMFPDKDRLTLASIALGPVAMFAVMAGYAVWWIVMLILHLLGFDENDKATAYDQNGPDAG
jgi:hypothetical protein